MEPACSAGATNCKLPTSSASSRRGAEARWRGAGELPWPKQGKKPWEDGDVVPAAR